MHFSYPEIVLRSH